MKFRARPLAALFAGLVAFSLQAGQTPDPLRAGWEELTFLNPNPALVHFREAGEADPNSREVHLGEALALLNAQPRSETNLAEARRIFEALATTGPDDEIGIAAAYYLARLRQIHDDTTDDTAAMLDYRALLQAHPGHPIAELAAPKLAILLLYADVAMDRWEQHVQEILTLLPSLQSLEARRDTRLILADALLKLRRDHARAYPLITYCLRENLVVRSYRLNTLLLQAAESARVLGFKTEAAGFYRSFLENAPYDVKSAEVRLRLAQLAPTSAP